MDAFRDADDRQPSLAEQRLLARNSNWQRILLGQNQKTIVAVGILLLNALIIRSVVDLVASREDVPSHVWALLVVGALCMAYAVLKVFAVILPRGYVAGYSGDGRQLRFRTRGMPDRDDYLSPRIRKLLEDSGFRHLIGKPSKEVVDGLMVGDSELEASTDKRHVHLARLLAASICAFSASALALLVALMSMIWP
jgi:hypothetical protein